jgi:DNA-binding NarL/FixJ family response regulator
MEMISKPNIIIVDDHLIFRRGLISILTIEDIATIIAEASNGEEFIELLSEHVPDLVLMDIDMPKMNGILATQKALELKPDLKIIAYSMYGEGEYYSKMIDLGVKGFILKSSGIYELEKAINEVVMGKCYFSSNSLVKSHLKNQIKSNVINATVEEKLAIKPEPHNHI